ncbi:MAG TPA: alpha-1,4-glucan--maltose-1-phosphate maltosyltransferase [Longimicrobiales bacterium]|nr:alpha-1,4-glucan--maltose-1-phosphate maltosyltransferase [Longimicrobiales bacterium]
MPPKTSVEFPGSARRRVIIEGLEPEVDGGRFPAKATPGRVRVECDAYADGHDAIGVVLLHRRAGKRRWQATRMTPVVNDRWRAWIEPASVGRYEYTVEGWVDPWEGWKSGMAKWLAARVDVETHLAVGAGLLRGASSRAAGGSGASYGAAPAEAQALRDLAELLERRGLPASSRVERAFAEEVDALMWKHADRSHATRYRSVLRLVVEPERARFSAWYELFPRSLGSPGRHGTFRDVEKRLAHVKAMGFDVLYLPPIHPIGRTHRKGKNNARTAARDDVGSPWAIGGEEGGHTAIHPELGSLADLKRLVRVAREKHGIEVALDIAFQVSPDHPWVKEHPQWFRHRPDGTIAYAENPPKKYEDIYPIDFETADWQALWLELEAVFSHWIEKAGITVYRVDNPHTKSLRFWEWCIGRLKERWPELILLSEAFTRPKVMYRLAKLGYTQSYTYFAWRRAKWELEEYFTELSRPPVVDFFRANAWPNTPDILTDQLQGGQKPVYLQRLILAGTLAASYGIYGPAFELMDGRPREPGKEEYLDSEKYQLRTWDHGRENLRHYIALVNRIRRENPALQHDRSLRFHHIPNDQLIGYSKWSHADGTPYTYRYGEERPGEDGNLILVIVNLDPKHTHSSVVHLPLDEWGIAPDESIEAHDLIRDSRYVWRGWDGYIELNPHAVPAHIFRIGRTGPRSEKEREEF